MIYRSWLLVAGDDEQQLGASLETGADVIVVDLGSNIDQAVRPQARQIAAEWLHIHRHQIVEQRRLGRWVRINSLDSRLWRDDLLAVMPGAPDGIVLPRSAGPEAVQQLGAEIYELEQRNQIPAGSTRIIPSAGETPLSAMTIGTYLQSPHQRLAGMSWDDAGLSSTLGATNRRDVNGGWPEAMRFVRAQILLAAHACGMLAIDTAYGDLANEKGLTKAAQLANEDGFSGMLALHPDQVPVINEAFTPDEAALQDARDIVSSFEGSPGEPTLQYDRRTIDQPHLKLARRRLGLEDGQPGETQRSPILRSA